MRRNDHGSDAHPDRDRLLARADGLLDADEAGRVDAHLAECVLCRLEVMRARRFRELDGDDDAATEALWEIAEQRLDAAWRARGRPAVLSPRRRVPRWLLPAAAAAVLALAVVQVGERAWQPVDGAGGDSLRGTPPAGPVIHAVAPSGELEGAPTSFAWRADRGFDSYDLEVFTDELATVFALARIPDTTVALPDSLRALLDAGRTYHWHVRGHADLERAEASETVWFRIGPAAGE